MLKTEGCRASCWRDVSHDRAFCSALISSHSAWESSWCEAFEPAPWLWIVTEAALILLAPEYSLEPIVLPFNFTTALHWGLQVFHLNERRRGGIFVTTPVENGTVPALIAELILLILRIRVSPLRLFHHDSDEGSSGLILWYLSLAGRDVSWLFVNIVAHWGNTLSLLRCYII